MRALSLVLIMVLTGVLTACTSFADAPTVTPPNIVRPLATVYISPTPNALQLEATARASSPTPVTPTVTPIPSATPYVGIFIGQAEREAGFVNVDAPFFADGSVALVPTANPDRCALPIESAYQRAWRLNPAVSDSMGCPIQAGFGFFGQVQVFEGGVMYLNPETSEVWAILDGDGRTGRYFVVENPRSVSTVGITAPPGFSLPEGRFANMWLSVEQLRLLIGFALTPPQQVGINLQRFDGGTFFLDVSSGQVFALLVDGTYFGAFTAPERERDVPQSND